MTSLETARKWKAKRWAEILQMPKIPCECGCGTMIPPFNKMFQPAHYVHGHMFKDYKPANPGGKGKGRVNELPMTGAEKAKRHREKKWAEIVAMPKIACACGCGELITPFTKLFKPARFAKGHNSRVPDASSSKGRFHYEQVAWNTGIKGEESHSFITGEGRAPYPLGFDKTLKGRIRKRDQFTCQHCGITQEQYGRTMIVHHIDHNKANLDLGNLVCACQKCNAWASRHRNEPFINPEIWERTHPTG